MNQRRKYEIADFADLIIGGILALVAFAFLSSGCMAVDAVLQRAGEWQQAIATNAPVAASTNIPAWHEATHSSNWRDNARVRHMNGLSPHMPRERFIEYVQWQISAGCNTVNLFVANQGDGEFAGYCIYGKSWSWKLDKAYCAEMLWRVAYCHEQGLAVNIWLLADDSSKFNKECARDFGRYLRDLRDVGLLRYASTVVVGLELDEYYNSSQVAALVAAVREVWDGAVATHETSGNMRFSKHADLVFYQLKTGLSPAQVETRIREACAKAGKPVCASELSRDPDRALCEAAFRGGAYGCGNWDREKSK